ncbi:cobalt-factor II C(20)-methyltransferase [Vulcanisaeta sp. JCM 14467]
MRLYVVGLGPGDEELVTVRAVKVLGRSRVIFIPYSTGTNRSLAEGIVRRYAPGDARLVLLGFPMSRDVPDSELRRLGETICREANGEDSAFVTLGDPTLYSTFFRVRDWIPCEVEVEVIPGVSSITACASRIGAPLAVGDDSIAIIPASRLDVLGRARDLFEAIVVLKASENLGEVVRLLREAGFTLFYARRCFMGEEEILRLGDDVVDRRDYFSMVIALRRGKRKPG